MEWYEDISWTVERWSYRVLTSISKFIGLIIRAASLVSVAILMAWALGRAEDRRRWYNS